MAVANPFRYADAGRYVRARPRYQAELLLKAARVLGLGPPVEVALDVGCGTGHSSTALLRWARLVVALDSVHAMLEAADRSERVLYVNALAEELPLAETSVDLLTAGAVFHWLDAPAFLAEAARVVRPGGGLVVYSDFFTGRVGEAPAVESWIKETYIPRHPGPPRGRSLTSELAASFGFELAGTTAFETPFAMTLEEFVDYLLTQSNALAAMQAGRGTEEELRLEIHTEVRPLFPQPRGTVVFGAQAQCLRRARQRAVGSRRDSAD
jgi:SAM-dependent methyltransferase